MRDNLSIVVLIILLVLIMIMFPLYNYFERQDDMSYNLALKATTNFVDEVLNSGYIDQDMYDKFIDKLSATGNLYDVQLEAHKKYLIKDPSNSNEYIEKSFIDYNDDIFKPIYESGSKQKITQKVVMNNVYKLNKGDQLYIKLKNSTTTMAGAIFNSIFRTSSKDRIVVNYGGIVKNNSWEMVDATYNEKDIYSDKIYYVAEEGYKDFCMMIYFKNVPESGYKFTIDNSIKFGGGFAYKSFDNKNLKNGSFTNITFNVDTDGVIKISGGEITDEKKNLMISDCIKITNNKNNKRANLVEYKTDYSKDSMLLNLEEEYRYNSIWPSMYNNILFTTNDIPSILDKSIPSAFKTSILMNYGKNGITMEALFTLDPTVDSDKSENKCIVGDWENGGGGIFYIPRQRIGEYFDNKSQFLNSDKEILKNKGAIVANAYINGKYEWVYYPYSINQGNMIKVSFTEKYDEATKKTKLTLYINGESKKSKEVNGKVTAPKNVPIAIGANIGGGKISGRFNGIISSVQVYERALTDSEIKSNYHISLLKYNLK